MGEPQPRTLNVFEQRVVDMYVKLGQVSQAAVARALNLADTTVGEHLAKPHVQTALVLKRGQLSDKTRDKADIASKMVDKALMMLNRALDRDQNPDIRDAAGATTVLMASYKDLLSLREQYGGRTEAHEKLETERKRTARAYKLGQARVRQWASYVNGLPSPPGDT